MPSSNERMQMAEHLLRTARKRLQSDMPQDQYWLKLCDDFLAGSAVETPAEHPDAVRLNWLANAVLACDYGDNSHGEIGWHVMAFNAPVMYGPSINNAIDAAIAKKTCGDGCKGCAYCRRSSSTPPEQVKTSAEEPSAS